MTEDSEIDEHPAYGAVVVHQYDGGSTYLFGSEAEHRHAVGLSVHHAYGRRRLSGDNHFATETIVELWFSEAQWAQMVASGGRGEGTQCTLRFVKGEGVIPKIQRPKAHVDKFKQDVREHLQAVVDRIDSLRAEMQQAVARPAPRKGDLTRLIALLRLLRQDIVANLPFVADRFEEETEERISRAKIEIEAYASRMLNRLGAQAAVDQGLLPGVRPEVVALPEDEYGADDVARATGGMQTVGAELNGFLRGAVEQGKFTLSEAQNLQLIINDSKARGEASAVRRESDQ